MKRHDIASFLLISILLALPASYEPGHFAKALFVTSFIQSVAYGLMLTLLIRKSIWLRHSVVGFVFILFCLESFLFFRFGSRFDPNILTLILQTTGSETKEFASVYLTSPFTLLFFTIAIGFGTMMYHLLSDTRLVEWGKRYTKGWIPSVIATMLLATGLLIQYLPLPCPVGKNTIHRLAESIDFVVDRHHEIDMMKVAIDSIVVNRTPHTEEAPIIVWVIGESFNKYHSSLYSYALPTSPYLDKELKSGNLTCYTHAMTPSSSTSDAMRYLFTLKDCEGEDSITLRPFVLAPAVFKKAGYKVAYFDNQYTRSLGGSLDYSCGYFLNPTYINEHCFDFRNTEILEYDGDFINRYSADFLKSSQSLNIIHLKGQHFDAALRFPTEFSFFGPDDIKRADLDHKKRQQVADYDNATLYNDHVINLIINEFRDKSAILIYLSDHGEQIYDSKKHYYGRGFGTKHEEETIKAVYETPLLIWCSNSFISKNKATYQAIRQSAKLPFCTADLAYLLFELAGIDFNYHDKTRSVINSEFIPHKTRF